MYMYIIDGCNAKGEVSEWIRAFGGENRKSTTYIYNICFIQPKGLSEINDLITYTKYKPMITR